MKLKGLATLALAATLGISATFAAPEAGFEVLKFQQKPMRNAVMVLSPDMVKPKAVQDPIHFLERKKLEITHMVKAGKITQAEADILISRLDEKITAIEEFNKMSTSEKKTTLIRHYQAMLDKKVQDGRISRPEADVRLKSFTDKIEAWDGNGYPDMSGFCEKNR